MIIPGNGVLRAFREKPCDGAERQRQREGRPEPGEQPTGRYDEQGAPEAEAPRAPEQLGEFRVPAVLEPVHQVLARGFGDRIRDYQPRQTKAGQRVDREDVHAAARSASSASTAAAARSLARPSA